MKKNIAITFCLSLGILVIFYLVPAYIMMYGYWPEELMIMKSPRYYASALNYIWILIISYSMVVVIGLIFLKNKVVPELIWVGNKNSIDIYLIFISSFLIIYSIDFKDIIQAESRFFSEHSILLNISAAILLYIFCKNLIVNKKNINNILIILICGFEFMIYPIAHSSRAAAIPFVVVALYFYYIRLSLFKGLIFTYLSAVFLGSALYTRDELGFLNFIQNLIYLFFNPGIIFSKIMYIIPGLGTTSLAMEMMVEKWEFSDGFLNFLLYISPTPSIFLPNKFWELGYSIYLNVTYMGLNTDYMSEWVWWFGFYGCIVGGIFTGLLTLSPLIIGNFLKLDQLFLMLINISSLYFLMAGTSMSLRSSSRFAVYVILLLIFKCLFSKLKEPRIA